MNSLSNRQRIGYGVGDIAICFYWSGVGLYLLYFYTDIVGISPYLAGWIYALGIAWDAVTDPFMGYLAERTSSKRGRYRPYILFGAIPLALSFILLFWVPPFTGFSLFICLLVINVFHRTCFTIVSVPYSSLTARINSCYIAILFHLILRGIFIPIFASIGFRISSESIDVYP